MLFRSNVKQEGADVIVKGPDAVILKLKTEEAACHYGRQTRWCTASTDANNMFNEYSNRGPLYVAMCSDGRKYQFHFETASFMDEDDEKVNMQELKIRYPTIAKFCKLKEPELMKDPEAAYRYAMLTLNEPWPEAEPYIMQDPTWAERYALHILDDTWPEAESHILKDIESATTYACELKGPWPELEPLIAEYPDLAYKYANDALEGQRFPAGEPNIAANAAKAFRYARYIIKGRWPEAEANMARNAEMSYRYAKEVIKGRFPEAEPAMLEDPTISAAYALDILEARWPEAEREIKKRRGLWRQYRRRLNLGPEHSMVDHPQ